MDDAAGHSALVWLDPEQADGVRAVAERAGLRIVGVGSSTLGAAPGLAAALGTGPTTPATFDDLRAAVTTAEADVVLLASIGDFASDLDSSDGEAIRACRAAGRLVVTLEPIPAGFTHLGPWAGAGEGAGAAVGGTGRSSSAAAGGEPARFCPRMRLTGPMMELLDARESFGPIRSVHVAAHARPGEGSVGARLYDAMDGITLLMGEPDQVYAAHAPAAHGRSLHESPGESLRGLHGEISAALRFADGRSAAVTASDRAGRWSRLLTVFGPGGQMVADDRRLSWIGHDETASPADERADAPVFAQVAGDQIRRMLDPHAPSGAPLDQARVLSVCGAALLSIRTGEAESPSTILRMARTA